LRSYIVSKNALDAVSATEHSQGVIAVTKLNVLGASSINPQSKYLLLDRVQDPGNIGAIIRTACAFGFKGVVITAGSADPFSPKVTRAAAGALWKIDLIKLENIYEVSTFKIIAADTEARTREILSGPPVFYSPWATKREAFRMKSGDWRKIP